MLKRILMMLGAQSASIGFNVIYQFLLPPVFLHYYGVADYGEWLVLSATLGYLATLNFGITTFSSNELTILNQRGDLEQYRKLQASTLASLLVVITIGTIAAIGVSFLPLPALLHLHSMSRLTAGWTALFLGLTTMVHMLGGYYNNLFMVVQRTHRGAMWANWRYFAPTVAAVPLAMHHVSFATIAFGQLAAVSVLAVATIIDLKMHLGGLPLGIKGANWDTTRSALVPSGMFAMVWSQQFLLFQVPVILLQRLLGPEVVVLFTISRTIFSMARRILSSITNAIAPEITFTYGSGDRKKLLEIFHYSERVVFASIPIGNLGTLLCAPLLLAVWIHKPELFEPWTYAAMALVSAVMSMREHKQFFQFSTNTHHRLAHIVFWGNLLMLAVSIPATMSFGLRGFMVVWLLSETTQMALLYRENKKLFNLDASITMAPVLKLGLLMALALPACMALVQLSRRYGYLQQSAVALAGTAVLFIVCYRLFGLNLVQQRLVSRIFPSRRLAPL